MRTQIYKQEGTDTQTLGNLLKKNSPWCLLCDHRAYKSFSRSKALRKSQGLFILNLFISFSITPSLTANTNPDTTVSFMGRASLCWITKTDSFHPPAASQWRFSLIRWTLVWALACVLPLWVTKCSVAIWDSDIWRWMERWSDSCRPYRWLLPQSPPSGCPPHTPSPILVILSVTP